MRRIELTQGQYAIVDDEDYDRLSCFKWYAWWNPCTKSFYPMRNVYEDGERLGTQQIAREIFEIGFDRNVMPDHINHDTLDTRKENLRMVDYRRNGENMRNQSVYGPGVIKKKDAKRKKPYEAYTSINGKRKHISYHETPEEARQARQDFLVKHDLHTIPPVPTPNNLDPDASK